MTGMNPTNKQPMLMPSRPRNTSCETTPRRITPITSTLKLERRSAAIPNKAMPMIPAGREEQAWGIYGFTLSYLYTGDTSFLKTAQDLADYFIAELPADKVSYWDLVFNDGSQEERIVRPPPSQSVAC